MVGTLSSASRFSVLSPRFLYRSIIDSHNFWLHAFALPRLANWQRVGTFKYIAWRFTSSYISNAVRSTLSCFPLAYYTARCTLLLRVLLVFLKRLEVARGKYYYHRHCRYLNRNERSYLFPYSDGTIIIFTAPFTSNVIFLIISFSSDSTFNIPQERFRDFTILVLSIIFNNAYKHDSFIWASFSLQCLHHLQ